MDGFATRQEDVREGGSHAGRPEPPERGGDFAIGRLRGDHDDRECGNPSRPDRHALSIHIELNEITREENAMRNTLILSALMLGSAL